MISNSGLRLVSWNVACRKDRARQAAVLLEREPDLIALQEVTRASAPEWRERLAESHLRYTADTVDRLDEYPTANLIASRWPLHELPPLVTPRPERFLSVMIETDQGPVELHNAHIPDGASNKLGKVQGFVDLYASLAYRSKVPRVLCGDFNSPELELSTGEVQVFGDAVKHPIWPAAERSVVEQLSCFGLRDVFRQLHGYERAEGSHTVRGTGASRRFDHVFAPPNLSARSCLYHHEWRAAGLSDHSAVEADFELPSEVPLDAPIDFRDLFGAQKGRTLMTQRGRPFKVLELEGSSVTIETERERCAPLPLAWFAAAHRRLQANGRIEASRSTLGNYAPWIGSVLAMQPGVDWHSRQPPRLVFQPR